MKKKKTINHGPLTLVWVLFVWFTSLFEMHLGLYLKLTSSQILNPNNSNFKCHHHYKPSLQCNKRLSSTGSVPGSYLGMDPAFLVWIPPLEEGDILKEIDDTKGPVYEV